MRIDPSLGLPSKYTEWRDDQYRAVEATVRSDRPVFLLDAPTGIGKSLIGIGVHRILRASCVYVTRTKQLQGQIMKDFAGLAVELKGKANYPCVLNQETYEKYPEITADDCRYGKPSQCPEYGDCPYHCMKEKAKRSPLVVLNDAYFLNEANGLYSVFSGRQLLVVDEVDSIEAGLLNYIEFKITTRLIDQYGLKMPEKPFLKQSWLDWIPGVLRSLAPAIEGADELLGGVPVGSWGTRELEVQRRKKSMAKLFDRLSFLQSECDSSWIFYSQEVTNGYEYVFKPVNIGKYSGKYLWDHATRALGMSGTIFSAEITCRDLGIHSADYMRVESPFPIENRPIYFRPVCNLTHKTMEAELPKLRDDIDQIVQLYRNGKVLVHTASYKIRDFLAENLYCQSRIMTHNSVDREAALIEFKTTGGASVMLSPSFDRGVDLPEEDNCQAVIVAKVPYLNLSDPQVKAKVDQPGGWEWYALKAAQTLVQETGRSIRSPTQKCDCWILDSQFSRLRSRMEGTIPDWWMKAVKDVRADVPVRDVFPRGK